MYVFKLYLFAYTYIFISDISEKSKYIFRLQCIKLDFNMYIYIYTQVVFHILRFLRWLNGHTYIYPRTHAWIHPCMSASLHACMHAYMHACIHANIHSDIHTHLHSDIHTIYLYNYFFFFVSYLDSIDIFIPLFECIYVPFFIYIYFFRDIFKIKYT